MRKLNFTKLTTTLIVTVLVILSTTFTSCKKWHKSVNSEFKTNLSELLPDSLDNEIRAYMPIYYGTTPPQLSGEFVSSKHVLIHASYDSIEDGTEYYDRYVAFTYSDKNGVDFYGKQRNDSLQNSSGEYYSGDYYEHVSKLNIGGSDSDFSCYYTTEGYTNGSYAKQLTVFSGTWIDGTGIKDFKVAVVLLETSGNTHLEPEGSYRVLGDKDGLAEVNNWMGKSSESTSYEGGGGSSDAFFLFRK